jgi:glutamate/tyrosine decarboxylase-like PLP-dependent enzyme
LPHPDENRLREMGNLTLDWLLAHHATLPQQPIGRPASRGEMAERLAEPPPEKGSDFAAVLATFEADVAPFACRVNHPRFLAFVPGAPTLLSVLGDFLCAGANFFAGVWLEAAGPSQVELLVLDWFREFLGMPSTTMGVLTSGGSEANLTALVVARNKLCPADRTRAVLYVSEQRHWSIDRAAMVLGLRADQVRPVAADRNHRLSLFGLAEVVTNDRAAGRLPWAVTANAGTTNTGTVDPLEEIADFCDRQQLWLHVDAAYGWTATLTPEGKSLLAGIGRADSITLDPHKWLAQTFDVGCILVREGLLLGRTFSHRPAYMQDVEPAEDEINFADHGIALTRRFRALKVWLSMKVLGVGWFRNLVRHCCSLAVYGQALLEAEGFEILSPAQLSIVCFRLVPQEPANRLDADVNRLNLDLVDAIRGTGRAFLSSTRLDGRVAIRFCFVNWRTTAKDVEEIVALLKQEGVRLVKF